MKVHDLMRKFLFPSQTTLQANDVVQGNTYARYMAQMLKHFPFLRKTCRKRTNLHSVKGSKALQLFPSRYSEYVKAWLLEKAYTRNAQAQSSDPQAATSRSLI